ncbi:hypothetical protein Q7C36_003082 [Tachysurus vachellii]|uniref:Uncharacterized protein n=1 Tax=Tachysurus vachellii TaxID=175792 RepID=A0AA88NPF1_TACVA|nr:hypothetical protein Q7C36_003082 [Tachysurus vachellii]
MSSQNSDTYQGLVDMLRQELLQTPGQLPHTQMTATNSATVVTVPMANPAPYSGVAEESLQPTQHHKGTDTPETKGPNCDWQTPQPVLCPPLYQ